METMQLESTSTASVPSKRINFIKCWLKRAGIVLAGAAGSYALISALAAYPLSTLLIKPRKRRLSQLSSTHLRYFLKRKQIHYKEIEFDSFDNTRLHGWFLRSGERSPTVIALHGVSGNRTNMMHFALLLYSAGFNVFMFDGRAHGLSQGQFVTYGYYETHDVSSIIDYLIREQMINEKSIGLIGLSMGAAISVQVAARDKRVQAIWVDSPFSSLERLSSEYVSDTTRLPKSVLKLITWTAIFVATKRGKFDINAVRPVEIASQLSCPIQLVHGKADFFVRPEHSQAIYNALTTNQKDIWLVEGAGHIKSFRLFPDEYSQRLITFFKSHL